MRHQSGPRRFPAPRALLPQLPPALARAAALPLPVLLALLVFVAHGPLAAGLPAPGPAAVPVGAPASPPAAGADADDGARSWPLAGRPSVSRGWEPPAGPYGPGHRGVDLAAGPGARVLAAADGLVSFAGPVAGRGVLVLEVADSGSPPLRTTYEPVRALVEEGAGVRAGQPVGVLEEGPFHCAEGCLHWGLRRGDAYLDPLSLLPPSLSRRGPSRLLPVFGVPQPRPDTVRVSR
ncbi:M23 family metallopeptidase [Streptomyces sp. NPDC006267]|uniref:murein hydrolase activator EnvC family protein n=1 Tax=unclassified Streptomyces TaxID=2593676 RepID=UPI00339EF136